MSFHFQNNGHSNRNRSLIQPKSSTKQKNSPPTVSSARSLLSSQNRPPTRAGGERPENQHPLTTMPSSSSSSTSSNRTKRKRQGLSNAQQHPLKRPSTTDNMMNDSKFQFIKPNIASAALLLPRNLASSCEEINNLSLTAVIPRKQKPKSSGQQEQQRLEFGNFQKVASPPPQPAQNDHRNNSNNSNNKNYSNNRNNSSDRRSSSNNSNSDRRNSSNSNHTSTIDKDVRRGESTPKSEPRTQSRGLQSMFCNAINSVTTAISNFASPSSSRSLTNKELDLDSAASKSTPPPSNSNASVVNPKSGKSIVDLCDDSAGGESDDNDAMAWATQPSFTPPAAESVKPLSTSATSRSSSTSNASLINTMLREVSTPTKASRRTETIITIPTTPITSPVATGTPVAASRPSPSKTSTKPQAAFTLSKASLKLSPVKPKDFLRGVPKEENSGMVKSTSLVGRKDHVGDDEVLVMSPTKKPLDWSIEAQASSVPNTKALTPPSHNTTTSEGFLSPPIPRTASKDKTSPVDDSPTKSDCINVEEDDFRISPQTYVRSGQKNYGRRNQDNGEAELSRIMDDATAPNVNENVVLFDKYKSAKLANCPSLFPPKQRSKTYGGGNPTLFSLPSRRTKTVLRPAVTSNHNARQPTKIQPGSSLSMRNEDDFYESVREKPPKFKVSKAAPTTAYAKNDWSDVGDQDAFDVGRAKQNRSNGINPSKFHTRNDSEKNKNDDDDLVDTDDEHEALKQKRRSKSSDDEEWKVPEKVKSTKGEKAEKNGRRTSARLRRFSLTRRPNEPIEIEDDSSVDEDQVHNYESLVYDVARIAIGKKIFTSGCQIALEPRGRLEISFRLPKSDSLSPPISIDLEHLRELKYFLAEEETSPQDSEDDEMSFLSMRVHPADSTGLKSFSNAYCQEIREANMDDRKKYIVVEFRSDKDFVALLDAMRGTELGTIASSDSKLKRFQIESYSRTLLEKNQKDKKQRLSSIRGSPTKRRNGFLANRTDKETLLVYPFPAAASDLCDAVKDLNELKGFNGSESDSMDVTDEDDVGKATSSDEAENNTAVRGRAHYVTIGVEDYCRLEAPEFFNDTLIDFWMQWMRRGESHSTVHFFTSHFYTTLAEEGVKAVSSWTAKRDIDIFEKKFIFVPVNKSLHWSLCVVVNPGSIYSESEEPYEEDKCPCMIFLDSLKAHRKNDVASKIRKWLDSEWLRLNKRDGIRFTNKNMPVYDPRVPYQDNCWDCGVFVCRYAFAMYQLRHLDFSFAQMDDGRAGFLTRSVEFQFDMSDINRIREEVRILLERLSVLYDKWKLEERRKQKAARLAAKSQLAAAASTGDLDKENLERNTEPDATKDSTNDEQPEQPQTQEHQEDDLKRPVIKIEPKDDDDDMDIEV